MGTEREKACAVVGAIVAFLALAIGLVLGNRRENNR